jgi:hypothetical protein
VQLFSFTRVFYDRFPGLSHLWGGPENFVLWVAKQQEAIETSNNLPNRIFQVMCHFFQKRLAAVAAQTTSCLCHPVGIQI